MYITAEVKTNVLTVTSKLRFFGHKHSRSFQPNAANALLGHNTSRMSPPAGENIGGTIPTHF